MLLRSAIFGAFCGASKTPLHTTNNLRLLSQTKLFKDQLGSLSMSTTSKNNDEQYVPPKVWEWDKSAGGLNRPISGPTHEGELPLGKHPLQLYSLATPNGVTATIFLEELLESGVTDAEYDAWPINIMKGDQFSSGFVDANPNSKIPTLVDRSDPNNPTRLFETGSILLQLAEKFDGAFIPKDSTKKARMINWLFWRTGSAPFLGGGFGHFFNFAPTKQEYPINRYAMETKRQLDVLDKLLEENQFIAGDEYSIADISIWPWYGVLVLGDLYEGSDEFLDVTSYKNVIRWAKEIGDRPAVKRGRKVNKLWGEKSDQLHERHDPSDFETKTADKMEENL